jgi:hypothetical protein
MNFEILTAGCRDPVVTGKCAMGVMIKTNRSGFSKTRHLIRPPSSFKFIQISTSLRTPALGLSYHLRTRENAL